MGERINEQRVGRLMRAAVLAAWAPTIAIAGLVAGFSRGPDASPPATAEWLITALAAGLVCAATVLPAGGNRIVQASYLLSATVLIALGLTLEPIRLAVAAVLSGIVAAVLASGNIHALLSALSVTWIALFLMLFELPILWPATERVEWGEPSTFAYLFPESRPVIGRGGRLRPGLDARMVHPDKPGGVRIITNGDGFRNERDFATPKPADEMRVLNLGDSFSIGYRIGQADFFGSVLARTINQERPHRPITVMNAEASDPATALYYLQQFGLGFEPTWVVYGLCGNDVMQASSLVGPGRPYALADGRIEWRSPAEEPRVDVRANWGRIVYPIECANRPPGGSSKTDQQTFTGRIRQLELIRRLAVWRRLLARTGQVTKSWMEPDPALGAHKPLLDGFPNLAFYYTDADEIVAPMYETCFAVLAAMADQCRGAGAELVVVLHPQRFVVQPQDWAAESAAWCLRPEDFDLDRLHRRIAKWCASQRIACVDLTPPFRKTGRRKQLYLPGGDAHYNEAGHRLAGETVAAFLQNRFYGTPSSKN